MILSGKSYHEVKELLNVTQQFRKRMEKLSIISWFRKFNASDIVLLNKNETLSGVIITNNFIKRCIDR